MRNTMSEQMMSTKSTMSTGRLLYQCFKYLIYAALTYNVYAFFVEEWAAFHHTFGGELTSASQLIEAFTATIDTAAWVLLLYLFEAETFLMSDARVKRYKVILIAVKAVCYAFIVYSCWGYISKALYLLNTSPFEIANTCSLIGQNFSIMTDLDEYTTLTAESCGAIANSNLLQINGTSIIAPELTFADAIKLAAIDVINAATWVVIVIALEVDVRLQLANKLTDHGMRVGYVIKGVLYATLFACAAYWGFYGDFLDFWDSFLWLLGFFMIELNIFKWHEEVKEEKEALAAS